MGISTSTGTLTAGQSRTFNLAPASAVTLTLSPNVRVTITETPAIVAATGLGGNASRVHEPRLPGVVTYGPYPMGGSVLVEVESNSGSSVGWSETSALFAKDTQGNVTGLSGSGGSVSLTNSLRGGSLLRSGKPWLRQPANTTGMLATSGSATIAATTRNGRKCIEVTIAAVTTPQGIHIPIATPQTILGNQHMVIEVEDMAEWNGGNFRLGFFDGTSGTLTNGMQLVQTVGTANGWTGIHCLAPTNVATTTSSGSTSEWAAVGTGAFNSTVMTQIAVRAVRKSGPVGTARFWIYEIADAEKNSLPSIIIGGDDGHLTWYQEGLPVLEKYGFSSYMAFIADDRGTATRMSQAQWADAIARGHHAVVHGCKTGVNSLRDYFASYTGYSSPQAAMEADIAYNRDTMVGEGLDPSGVGRTVYVLPQGVHQPSGGAGDNTIANALTSQGMTVCRRAVVEGALMANGGWSGSAMYLPIIGHNWANANEATNITNLVSQMQTEIAAGRSVVLMFHEVRAVPALPEQITAANLETIVAAAAVLVQSGAAKAGKMTDFAQELKTYTSPVHVGQ